MGASHPLPRQRRLLGRQQRRAGRGVCGVLPAAQLGCVRSARSHRRAPACGRRPRARRHREPAARVAGRHRADQLLPLPLAGKRADRGRRDERRHAPALALGRPPAGLGRTALTRLDELRLCPAPPRGARDPRADGRWVFHVLRRRGLLPAGLAERLRGPPLAGCSRRAPARGHLAAQGRHRGPAPSPPYYYHSRARYFAKFYGRYGLWFANLAWWAGRTVSLLRETFGAKQAHTCEGAGRDIWRHSLDPFASLARTREEAR